MDSGRGPLKLLLNKNLYIYQINYFIIYRNIMNINKKYFVF